MKFVYRTHGVAVHYFETLEEAKAFELSHPGSHRYGLMVECHDS